MTTENAEVKTPEIKRSGGLGVVLGATDSLVEFFGLECIVQFREPILLCQATGAEPRGTPIVSTRGKPIPMPIGQAGIRMQPNWPIEAQTFLDAGVPTMRYTVTLDKAVLMPSVSGGRVLVMYTVGDATMQASVAPDDIVAVTKVGMLEPTSAIVQPGA